MLKKLPYFLTLMFLAISCSDKSDDIDNIVENSIKIEKKYRSLVTSEDGQSTSIEIETTKPWASKTLDDANTWLSYTPTSGPAGKSIINFSVKDNDSYDSRSGRVVLSCGTSSDTIWVRQAAKGAIIIAEKEYQLDYEPCDVDVYIATNLSVMVKCSADWAHYTPSRALEEQIIKIKLDYNPGETRECTVTFSNGEINQEISITQNGVKKFLDRERAALVAFYKKTGGDNWKDDYGTPLKENWLSDKPVGTWNGVTTDEYGRVIELGRSLDNLCGEIPEEIGDLEMLKVLRLPSNHLTGKIPSSIGNCKNLKYLYLSSNQLEGDLPVELFQCKELEVLDLCYNHFSGKVPVEIGNLSKIWALSLKSNNFSGEIPKAIGNLTNLESLYLDGNNFYGQLPSEIGNCKRLKWAEFSHNNFSGSIPESYGDIPDLTFLELEFCNLSGDIPSSIINHKRLWEYSWGVILYGNNFNTHSLTIPAPIFTLKDIDNNVIDSSTEYAKNKLTILFQWNKYCGASETFFPKLNELYKKYHDAGLDVIGLPFDQNVNDVRQYLNASNVKWRNIITSGENTLRGVVENVRNMYSPEHYGSAIYNYFPTEAYPGVTMVDSKGNVVFSDIINNPNSYEYFVKTYLEPRPEIDGEVKLLQKATKGDGIDIVLIGDGFTEEDISSGKYEKLMQKAADAFFSIEPYRSYRELFNLNMVYAVSSNNEFNGSSTALGCWFGDGTTVGGDDSVVFGYADKAIGSKRVDNSLIIVIMNSSAYAGTCYMYCSVNGGPSIAYFPVNDSEEGFVQLLHHEAGGHGFGKLADEYATEGNGRITEDKIAEIKNMHSIGRYLNVSTSKDIKQSPWCHFDNDSKYSSEGLGLYEGGATFEYGVYRPTENSIMRYNVGGFNAPSREIIWKRIHLLAYGDNWTYNFDDFLEYDSKNIDNMTSANRSAKQFRKTTPPVLKNIDWRSVKK